MTTTDLEAAEIECICGEINARHCQAHNDAHLERVKDLNIIYLNEQIEKSAARILELEAALEKIADAERMGYGTQRTYGEMAIAALQKSKGDE